MCAFRGSYLMSADFLSRETYDNCPSGYSNPTHRSLYDTPIDAGKAALSSKRLLVTNSSVRSGAYVNLTQAWLSPGTPPLNFSHYGHNIKNLSRVLKTI